MVLEHLDRQMLEPGEIGTPKQVKEELRDLFKAYASYKGQLVALLPKKGEHYEEVPGVQFQMMLNALDEGLLWSCMEMQGPKSGRSQEWVKGGCLL